MNYILHPDALEHVREAQDDLYDLASDIGMVALELDHIAAGIEREVDDQFELRAPPVRSADTEFLRNVRALVKDYAQRRWGVAHQCTWEIGR